MPEPYGKLSVCEVRAAMTDVLAYEVRPVRGEDEGL